MSGLPSAVAAAWDTAQPCLCGMCQVLAAQCLRGVSVASRRVVQRRVDINTKSQYSDAMMIMVNPNK